jgi:putative ABC transport system permease protein
MRSLAGVSVRNLVRTRRRYVLTSVGASLGVAVLFAVLVTGEASRTALDDAIRGQIGRADVVISPAGAFDSTLPEGVRDRVAALPDVADAVPSVGMRSSVSPVDGGGEAGVGPRDRIVQLSGAGAEQDRMNERTRVEGRAPADGAPEVEVPLVLADRLGVGVGDALRLATPEGPATVTITGLLADRGAATANQGGMVFASVGTVQGLIGAPGAVNGVAIDLAPGTDVARWIDAHRDALADVSVQDAADVAVAFRSFIDGVQAALTLVAGVAVFVGGFLVYLTFSVAVAERTRMLGTLRALGGVRRRVQRVVVIEAALLGVVCSGVGLVIGYLLSVVSVSAIGTLFELDTDSVAAPLGPAVFSAVVGVLVAVLASWLPARRAARIDPVSAMRGGALAIERAPRPWLGPVLVVVGGAGGLVSGSQVVTGLAMAVLLAGAVLSVHRLMPPLGRVAGAAVSRFSPGMGAMAVRHVDRERSRSSYTLALVMVSLATVLAVASSHRAMAASLDEILDEVAGAIQVSAPGAADDELAGELAAVPGVDRVSAMRFGTTEVRSPSDVGSGGPQSSSFLQIIDPATYFDVAGFPLVEGDRASVRAALGAGGATLLPAPDANRLGVDVGDQVELTTVDGPAPFTVAGTYAVLGGGFGTVVSTVDLERLGGGRVNGYLVGTDGADVEQVAASIRDGLGERRQLVVDSPADARAYAEGQLDGFFALGYAILVVAAIISLLGLANTLVVAVLARTREIGVLRSYGARRGQIRSMITVEAVTMAAMAIVLAVPLAAAMGVSVLEGLESSLGATVEFSYPWSFVPPLAAASLLVAAVAAAIPARRAGRLEIVDALRSE